MDEHDEHPSTDGGTTHGGTTDGDAPGSAASDDQPLNTSKRAQDAPVGLEPTGDARVDEALSRLADLDDKPVAEHGAVVEDVHRALQEALAEDED